MLCRAEVDDVNKLYLCSSIFYTGSGTGTETYMWKLECQLNLFVSTIFPYVGMEYFTFAYTKFAIYSFITFFLLLCMLSILINFFLSSPFKI